MTTDTTAEKPYRVICISMYVEDLDRLDAVVEVLKERGIARANRSALIRYALEGLTPGQIHEADLGRVRGEKIVPATPRAGTSGKHPTE